MERLRHPVARGLLLAALPALVYAGTGRAGWLWDDSVLIFDNPLVKQAGGLAKIWFSSAPVDYQPVVNTLFWLEYQVFGRHPGAYHVVNVLLHALAALLLWRLLAALEVPGAWLGALVFAVHPVAAESVCWISEQKNTLCAVFYALAALLFLRAGEGPPGGRRGDLAALGLFALALASKPAGAALPLVFLVLLAWRRGRLERRDFVRVAPFVAVAAAFSMVTIWFQVHRAIGSLVLHPRGGGVGARLAGSAWDFWFYLGKDLAPVRLAAVYPRWTVDAAQVASWLPLLALAVGAALLWRLRRADWARAGLVGLACYLLLLLPILGFVDIAYMRYSLVADHFQYLALAVFAALTGAVLARAPKLLAVVVAAALCVLSWQRSQVFADSTHLWEDTVRKTPSAWVAHHMLGSAYLADNRLPDAERELRRALQLNPRHSLAWYNLGLVRMRLGDYGEATHDYLRALGLEPGYVEAANNLAWLYATCPRARFRDEAAAVYWARRACALSGDANPLYLDTLAAAYANEGRYREAVGVLDRALVLADPSDAVLRAALEQRRSLYRTNRPYREGPAP